jgi:hypothetical protein
MTGLQPLLDKQAAAEMHTYSAGYRNPHPLFSRICGATWQHLTRSLTHLGACLNSLTYSPRRLKGM